MDVACGVHLLLVRQNLGSDSLQFRQHLIGGAEAMGSGNAIGVHTERGVPVIREGPIRKPSRGERLQRLWTRLLRLLEVQTKPRDLTSQSEQLMGRFVR
jgi:hypothetical protein